MRELLPKLMSSDKTVAEATFATLKANQELKMDEKALNIIIAWIQSRINEGESSSDVVADLLDEKENEFGNQSPALTITPPSYALDDETKIANWPKRPDRGAHSEKNYYDRRIHRSICFEDRIRRELMQANKTNKLEFQLTNNQEIAHFNGYFYGVLHPAAIDYILKVRELAIFWPGFEPTEELFTSSRLLLAYKTSREVLHFLPLNKLADGRWSIFDFGFKAPLFKSLKVMISYLRDAIFVSPNKKTIEYEHIPVWQLDDKTLDVRQMTEY
ncbi:hypothetical protein M3Y94_00878700 [Aphelenchoides besseyi]|nr:hypothetical protein M3Y94_00878700 [Aphelenchoides besseyi]